MKVSRPSFIPFWGVVTIEKRIPLSLVIDIIIEQGIDVTFLDSSYDLFALANFFLLFRMLDQLYSSSYMDAHVSFLFPVA